MPPALLDVLDSELRLFTAAGAHPSPAFVLHDGDGYHFGDRARAQVRRLPRQVNNRFWWQLGTTPLQPGLGPARHCADLVHQHLLALHSQAGDQRDLILSVPDSLDRDQLALLLGIVKATPWRAVGLVNRSVLLAGLASTAARRCCHIELQLHQALVSELVPEGGSLRLEKSHAVRGQGLLAMQDRLIDAIAANFIRNTRFDPRRQADAEQTLYDSLPDVLEALAGDPEVTVTVGDHSVRVTATELQAVGHGLQTALATAAASALESPRLIDPALARIPGFDASQGEVLPAGLAGRALGHWGETLTQDPDDLHLLRSLPVGRAGAREPVPTPGRTEPQPEALSQRPSQPAEAPYLDDHSAASHALIASHARRLRREGLELGPGLRLAPAGGGWVGAGDAFDTMTINGRPARPGETLGLGDRATFWPQGLELLLIRVDD